MKFVRALNLFVCAALMSTLAVAQEGMEKETGFTVIPRAWIALVDPQAGPVAKKESFTMPIGGLTFLFSPGSQSHHSFLLTGLWGSGDGDAFIPALSASQPLSVNPVTIDIPGTGPVEVRFSDPTAGFQLARGTGGTDVDRVDVEFLARYSSPGKWYTVFYGARYVRWSDSTHIGTSFIFSIEDLEIIDPVDEPIVVESVQVEVNSDVDFEAKIWGFEAGLGTVAELTGTGRHRLFSNFIFGAGYVDWEAQGTVSPDGFIDPDLINQDGTQFAGSLDAAIGYQFSGTRLAFNLRYRVFVLDQSNIFDQDQFTTIHGPELGFAVHF